MPDQPSLVITQRDYEKLSSLLAGIRSNSTELLEEELNRAKIVPSTDVPKDVVTMNSKVNFIDLDTGKEWIVSLVYPHAANADEDRISILAPIGIALIGLRVGQEISWPLPHGKAKRLKVVSILYQPEAAGEEA